MGARPHAMGGRAHGRRASRTAGSAWHLKASRSFRQRSGEVEAAQVHHLGPCRHEALQNLLLRRSQQNFFSDCGTVVFVLRFQTITVGWTPSRSGEHEGRLHLGAPPRCSARRGHLPVASAGNFHFPTAFSNIQASLGWACGSRPISEPARAPSRPGELVQTIRHGKVGARYGRKKTRPRDNVTSAEKPQKRGG